MKYKIIKKVVPSKFINEKGKVVILSEKDETEQITKSSLYPDGTRVLKAATQEDLKYAFEKLGMTEFIEVAEEEKQIDNTKK
jgi:hypothetical protein